MSKRTSRPALRNVTDRFVRGGDGDFASEGPTVLPPPWSPPPDPEFRTGTVLHIERADLDAGLKPGFEPSDSAMATVRFSRAEVDALIEARTPRARRARTPARRPLAPPPPPSRYVIGTPPSRFAELFVAYRWRFVQLALPFVLGVLTGVIAMR